MDKAMKLSLSRDKNIEPRSLSCDNDCMELDLEATIYKQADVLRLVPGLSMGTLQNWVARKVFEVEGEKKKHAKAHWSAISIIAITFMVEAGRMGIKPTQASLLADEIIQEIDSFLDRFKPEIGDDGVPEYILEWEINKYRQARIWRAREDEFRVSFVEPGAESVIKRVGIAIDAPVSITVEMDILFLMTLNALHRVNGGLTPYPTEKGS